jgi:signal transduction histidine kinase
MNFLNTLSLVVGGVSWTLSLILLLLVLWADIRNFTNVIGAIFTGTAGLWYLGLLLSRSAIFVNAPDSLIALGMRLFEAGYTASCAMLYLFVVSLTGGAGRFFIRLAVFSISLIGLFQLGLSVFANSGNSLLSITSDGGVLYGYGLIWSGVYGVLVTSAGLVLISRWRKLPDPLIGWGLVVFGMGVFIELISSQLRSRGVPLLIALPGLLLMMYTLVKNQIMFPLAGRETELRALRDVGLAITSRIQLNEVLNTIAAQAAQLLYADGAAIFLKQGDRLDLAAVYNMPSQFVGHQLALKAGEGLASEVVLSGEAKRLEDYRRDWSGTPDMDYARDSFGSVIAAPLRFDQAIVGVLFVVVNPQGRRFDREDVRLLEMLGPQAAVAIINSRLFEKQQELDRLKNQMIRMTSHDLKNPLFAAMSHVELLQEAGEDIFTDEMRGDLQTTWTQLTRMERIIRGILDLERVQNGKPSYEEYDFQAMVRGVVTEFSTHAKRQGVELIVTLPENLPEVTGDKQFMTQAVANLIENAIKFTDVGGKVSVSADSVEGIVTLHVQDTGVGIPDDAQTRIFERFFRAHHPGKEPVSGTGLGLSLVKAVSDAHGGRLWLESQVGVGTTFHLALPIQGPQDARIPE